MSTKTRTVWMLMVCLLTGVAASAVWVYKSGFNVQETAYLYVDSDDTVDSVGQKLAIVGQPQSIGVFRLYASLLQLDEHLHTGRYAISPDQAMLTLVRHLRNHSQEPVNLVVPSVRTMNQLAKRLSVQLMLDSADIAEFLADSACIASLGHTQASLPGLFIPNTYEVYWDVSIETLMERLQKEHDRFWTSERKAKLAEVSDYSGQEMTQENVATLASIVDSETANNGEKPTIAALYMNRLRQHLPLQSDPTVIYAIGDFTMRRVRGEHLRVESPYNTYRNKGLPPGPIRVPSIAGIDAVLNHTRNDYLYMCAKEDFSGTHNFAVSYGEHQRNAARYVKALNARGILH